MCTLYTPRGVYVKYGGVDIATLTPQIREGVLIKLYTLYISLFSVVFSLEYKLF